MSNGTQAGWIGVDLDGTLAHYDGWKGVEHVGAPIPAMLARVKQWISEGREVRIFTARVYYQQGNFVGKRGSPLDPARAKEVHEARRHIDGWCKKHIGKVLPITCEKDMGMIELWDDRAVQVDINTGRRADGKP